MYTPIPMFDERLVMLLLVALLVRKHEVARIVFAAPRQWDHMIDLTKDRAWDRFAAARTQPILFAK